MTFPPSLIIFLALYSLQHTFPWSWFVSNTKRIDGFSLPSQLASACVRAYVRCVKLLTRTYQQSCPWGQPCWTQRFFPWSPRKRFLIDEDLLGSMLLFDILYLLTVSWRLGDEGLAEGFGGEREGSTEVVPLLAREGVDGSLLDAFLATCLKAGILALSHFI